MNYPDNSPCFWYETCPHTHVVAAPTGPCEIHMCNDPKHGTWQCYYLSMKKPISCPSCSQGDGKGATFKRNRPKPAKLVEKHVEHRPDCRVICELPPGTTVKALDGVLVACHPNHAPIYIGGIPHER